MDRYVPSLNLLYRALIFTEGVLGKHVEGAQAMVLKKDRILLIRTTYRPHWEFPGGKMEKGEAPEAAVVRETKEEASVFIRKLERKLGTYTNERMRRKDIIHVYVAGEWEERDLWRPSYEIAERQFFPLDQLPEDLSYPTKLRIEEYRSGHPHEFIGAWEQKQPF